MSAELEYAQVGPWPMNTYVITCTESRVCAIIDPGAEAKTILSLIEGRKAAAILITHSHPDHIGALEEVRQATGVPVYMHPSEEGRLFNGMDLIVKADRPLMDGQMIPIGKLNLRAVHTPGHTPGMTCFDLGDGRVIVGDTLFVGGPGKTWSAQDFQTTMNTLKEIVFAWPDHTKFYPGHGSSGQIGIERRAFVRFAARGWAGDLFGDITWE